MNIFSTMFNTKPLDDANAPPAAPQAGDKPLSAAPPTADPTGKLPGDVAPVNPLDAYKKMFDNAAKNSDIQAPSFKIDPKILGEVSNTMDFTKGVAPELMEKALAGDAKSLLAVIQSVGRNSYSASLEHATALTETHLGQRTDFESKRLDQGVKQHLTSNALSTAPNYNHPVVKNELNRVATHLSRENPDASPQEIASAAQQYIADLSAALNPPKTKAQEQAASGEMDWSQYLK